MLSQWPRKLMRRYRAAAPRRYFPRSLSAASLVLLVALALYGCTPPWASSSSSSTSTNTSTNNAGPTIPSQPADPQISYTYVGPKKHYLALGDSLAFGYMPTFNYNNGYAQKWYSGHFSSKLPNNVGNLQSHGVQSETNYACAGETTQDFIHGNCPHAHLRHITYPGSQLSAALNFIHQHPGQVSPVTLDIGADDVLPLINVKNCSINSGFQKKVNTVNSDLTNTILPQLTKALTDSAGHRTGDLMMMNYYDPYQNKCPNSVKYVQQFNQALANDAAKFNIPVVNVFAAFGGSNVPNPEVCKLTWMCSNLHGAAHYLPLYNAGIHPQPQGYTVIAESFARLAGY